MMPLPSSAFKLRPDDTGNEEAAMFVAWTVPWDWADAFERVAPFCRDWLLNAECPQMTMMTVHTSSSANLAATRCCSAAAVPVCALDKRSGMVGRAMDEPCRQRWASDKWKEGEKHSLPDSYWSCPRFVLLLSVVVLYDIHNVLIESGLLDFH